MKIPRYLTSVVEAVLARRKMVFLGGPRQVGKTTLGLSLLGPAANEHHAGYLNWDNPGDAARLRGAQLPAGQSRIVLDEIHKYARWRNLLKGFYDKQKSTIQFVVTGSARLDYYRKGGDSLANRYRYFRLHPLSVNELDPKAGPEVLADLLKWSGFPEPFFTQDEAEHRIWRRDRLSRVIREDLRDLELVREVSLIEQLVDLLPVKVGSPLSVKSLREGLEVDHKTVERWLTILENLYVCFRIPPFGAPRIRAVKKERKLYLFDWTSIGASGPRFENLVACQLLKYCHWIEDTQGYGMELRYLRDTDGREVDFVVLREGKPLFAVECKSGEASPSRAIRYFEERTSIPVFYQVHSGSRQYDTGRIRVRTFWDFCRETEMP